MGESPGPLKSLLTVEEEEVVVLLCQMKSIHSLPLSLLCSSAISSSFCLALGSRTQGGSFQDEVALRLTFFSNVLCRP